MGTRTVLLTGAAGFIGFHLSNKLRELGYRVVGVDCFTPYYDVQLKRSRAQRLEAIGVTMVEGDVRDQAMLRQLLEKEDVSQVVHLAAQAGVLHSLVAPESYLSNNVDGFLSVLECLRYRTEIPLLYASSSSVYGHNTKIPFSEDDRTDTPANMYAVTKKCNELMAYTYRQMFGVRSIGLRFFTVYGPWGRPDMAYFLFTKKIFGREPIELFGERDMSRDFTYVGDIVDGITRLLEQQMCAQGVEPGHLIYNLGNAHPEKITTLIACLERCIGLQAKVQYGPPRLGELVHTYAQIDRAHGAFGFSPKVSLEEGIERFVRWYVGYYHPNV